MAQPPAQAAVCAELSDLTSSEDYPSLCAQVLRGHAGVNVHDFAHLLLSKAEEVLRSWETAIVDCGPSPTSATSISITATTTTTTTTTTAASDDAAARERPHAARQCLLDAIKIHSVMSDMLANCVPATAAASPGRPFHLSEETRASLKRTCAQLCSRAMTCATRFPHSAAEVELLSTVKAALQQGE